MAERIVLQEGEYPQAEPERALPRVGSRAGSVAGSAIVLACLLLPFVLGALADAVEWGAQDGYIRALHGAAAQTGKPVSSSALLTIDRDRPAILDQNYYFVNGCIAAPRDCVWAGPGNWGEYYDELRRLYVEEVTAAASSGAPGFDDWARTHVHFIIAEVAAEGANRLQRELASAGGTGAAHIVGTSAGGSAVFTYLSRAMRGDIPLDTRIRSVLAVDAPLGAGNLFNSGDILHSLIDGLQASSMRTDMQPGIGDWASAADIAMLTIDTQQDIVGFSPVPGIPYDSRPTYTQADVPPASEYMRCTSFGCRLSHMLEFLDLGGTWHIYGGSHMSESARHFVDENWR